MSALLGISVFDFISASWPLTLVSLVSGTLWGLAGMDHGAPLAADETPKREIWRRLFQGTWPLLLVILSVVVLKLNMILSLIGVIVLFVAVKRLAPREWWPVIKGAFPVHTFTAILGVMIFKHVLEDAGAVNQIPAALSMLGLPAMLVAFVVPMIVGLLTGTAAATLALSVPLVAPLLEGGALTAMGAGVWLFVGGFSGVLLSPLHLCLALTKDYFGATWGDLYRRIVPAVALVVVAAMGLVLLT
jgi:integral membrane protein (TIGR00529 family)